MIEHTALAEAITGFVINELGDSESSEDLIGLVDRLAFALTNRFHFIPDDQCERVAAEYMLPHGVITDLPIAERAHRETIGRLVSTAFVNGMMIITEPVRVELPSPDPELHRFSMAAIGWRYRPPSSVPGVPPPPQETPHE